MLKAIIDSLDSVPEELREHYVERNGKYELSAEGMRTEADVARVQESLRKEREDHRKVKERLSLLGDLNVEDVHTQLSRIPELEIAAKGALDEAGIEKIVQVRLKSATAPLERKLSQAEEELKKHRDAIGNYEKKDKVRTIKDAISSLTIGSSAKIKVIPEAVDDIMMYAENALELGEDGQIRTRDGIGIIPGLGADVWLTDMLQKKPHWCGPTEGGGASGSGRNTGMGGKNPFSHEHWNMTEQGKLLKEDRPRAEQMARAAGTTIGGGRPAPKK